ncbi:hypothetical protein [Glaesserella australis]|nr:hypothetical protein [Glaesserella australis]
MLSTSQIISLGKRLRFMIHFTPLVIHTSQKGTKCQRTSKSPL